MVNRCSFELWVTLDAGSELLQLDVHLLVAAIEMLYFVDLCGAVCRECGDNQCGTGTEVCSAYGATVEFWNSVNSGSSVFKSDGSAESIEFVDVLKAFREHAISDGTGSRGDAEQCSHLGLQVGRESGVRFGDDVFCPNCTAALDTEAIFGLCHADSDVTDPVEKSDEVIDGSVGDSDISVSCRGGDGKRGGFDAIGDDGVIRSCELFDAVDFKDTRFGEFDAGTSSVEEASEFRDFRLLSCIADHCGALCEHCCGEHIAGTCDSGAGRSGEVEIGGGESISAGVDPAVGDLEVGAECCKSAEVEINGARADAAATGERDCGGAESGEEWSEQADSGAHAADERFIGRSGRGCWRMDTDAARNGGGHRAVIIGRQDLSAGGLQEEQHGLDVKQRREITNDGAAVDGERSSEDGQRRVLAAADRDRSGQRRSSVNAKIGLQKGLRRAVS